jgi:hypothetical protein
VLGVLAPATGRSLIWPVVLLSSWAGRGPNIGTSEQPVYEGTPVHLVAAAVGLALCWVFYVLLARAVLWRIGLGREERDLTR